MDIDAIQPKGMPILPLNEDDNKDENNCTDLVVKNQNEITSTELVINNDQLNKKRKSLWDEKRREKSLGTRKSRWEASYTKTFTPLPYSFIPKKMTADEFEILIRRTRLDDINKRINLSEWEQSQPELRSPSPEPIYDPKRHIRLNTFDARMKETYNRERNTLIQELLLLDKKFSAPSDWKPPKKNVKLYYTNTEENNITALILGQNGASIKELEKKTGCKISIRGEGSNWLSLDPDSDPNEPIHVFLQSNTEEGLRKGAMVIAPLLDPKSEEHILFKNRQLENHNSKFGLKNSISNLVCENCGLKGHSTWACPSL